jgi:hypothetical protein
VTTRAIMTRAALRGYRGQSEDNPYRRNTPAYELYHRHYLIGQHRRAVAQSIETSEEVEASGS